MKELKIFENEEFGRIRTVIIDNEPWFVGKDVAVILGYSDPSSAVSKNVDDEDKTTLMLGQAGSNYKSKTSCINESGLYSLILTSKLPNAKKFKHWVTSEVLPQIRQTGQYSSQKQDSYMIEDPIERAKRWIEEQKEKLALQAENEQMKPKAEYFDDLVDRNLLTNFRDTAKELHIKQKEFITFLIEQKYIYRDTHGKLKPSASSEGLFELKEYTKSNHSGTQTLVTPKGRETFRLLLRKGA